jgi:tRNA-specific 2-thiouridylase
MKERVLLGMSSGIDSSVAAILLKNKGFDVVGITFVFSELETENQNMINSAHKLAASLNIEHHVIDLREEFHKKVISYFKQEYINGQTPFPCAVCNPEVKFKNLIHYADQYNCQYISTGHYVQIAEEEGVKYISKGVDNEKDQSFFLWGLEKSVVNRLIFPLGKYMKFQVREIAKINGFSYLTKKKESLGICFIEDNNYRNYLKNSNIIPKSGNFITPKGEILGRHNGYINFTIGQRRGLGINLNKPLFVSEIRPVTNEVVLAEFNELGKTKIYIQSYHFIHKGRINTDKDYIVKIRYRLQENHCNIRILNESLIEISLKEPVFMVAKGQTAVIYNDERVIGGGFIADSN